MLSIIGLLLILCFLIWIPPVQDKILKKVITTLEDKTHGKIELEGIYITFPLTAKLIGLTVNDPGGNKLIAAKEISASLSFGELIKGNLEFGTIALKKIDAYMNRSSSDSLYNFQFIIDAFAKKDKQEVDSTKAKKPINFKIDAIEMDEVHFLMDDRFGGIFINADVGKFSLKFREINLNTLLFSISKGKLVNSKIIARIDKKSSTKGKKSDVSPEFSVKELIILNTEASFASVPDSLITRMRIADFELKNAGVKLKDNNFSLENLTLNNSSFYLQTQRQAIQESDIKNKSPKQLITASAGRIEFLNNKFEFHNGIIPIQPADTFSAKHIVAEHISGNILNGFFNGDFIKGEIQNFTFLNNNKFFLKQFDAKLNFDQHHLSVRNLKVKTNKSVLFSSASLNYSSLSSLKKNPGELIFTIAIANSNFNSEDLAYFAPSIKNIKQLKLNNKNVSLAIKATGKVKEFTIENLMIQTGVHTSLSLKGKLKNINQSELLQFTIPSISFNTTKEDINAFLIDSIIPASISLPSTIQLNSNLEGSRKYINGKFNLGSEFGKILATANLNFNTDTLYNGSITLSDFELGKLLKGNDKLGKVNLTTNVEGQGLSKEKLKAKFDLSINDIYFNNYTYHNAIVKGGISDQKFSGNGAIKDSSIELSFDGAISFKPAFEYYKFDLHVDGVNLLKLNLTKEDIRLSAETSIDLKGNRLNNINGNALLSKIIIVKNDKNYLLDSLLFTAVNNPGSMNMNFRSALLNAKLTGNFSAEGIKDALMAYINKIYKTGVNGNYVNNQQFTFEIELKNHPIISDLLLPKLTEFKPGIIKGNFDSGKEEMIIQAEVNKIVYAGQTIKDFKFNLNSTNQVLNAEVYIGEASNQKIKLNTFFTNLKLQNNKGEWTITIGTADNRKLAISGLLTPDSANSQRLIFNPVATIDQGNWEFPKQNYIVFNKAGIKYHGIQLKNENEEIALESGVNETKISFKNFDLSHISKMVQHDSSLVSGYLSGFLNFSTVKNVAGLNADFSLKELKIYETPIGDLLLKAKNSKEQGFDFNLSLKGNENDVLVNGRVSSSQNATGLNITADVNNINAKILDGLSFGNLSSSNGFIQGKIHLTGTTINPEFEGSLNFKEVTTIPKYLKSRITLTNEKINFNRTSINLSSFTLRDYKNNKLEIKGDVELEGFSPGKMNLILNADNFRVFNTTITDNKLFYGQLIIGGNIKLGGNTSFPIINANVHLDEGSTFAFVVPETKLSSDKGEDIIIFRDTIDINSILIQKAKVQPSDLKGYEITSRIQIDSKATLKVLIDPTTGDSLVVRGSATLSFSVDQSGRMSLTGIYDLKDGSYVTTLEDLIHKQFKIVEGSKIQWNGDPLDADVNIDAIYTVKTSPIDLVATQIEGMSEAEKNQYKARLSFLVYLQLRGQLLKPEISFRIELSEGDKGALQGSVDNKLKLLNENPSELNKQVFALLLLNRFIQQDPLASEAGGTEMIARTSVSKFLSAQLNQLAGKTIAGAELNFDVQSFEDYSSGSAQGRTQVGLDIKKNLFNDRFSVQVGGNVDVEGKAAENNNMSDLTGDVLIEYKITKDGRLRFSAFRRNQYEDIIEGQVTETGIGLLFTRDFDKWKNIFTSPQNE